MGNDANGARRPLQFWVAILGIGGAAVATILLIVAVTALALYGTSERSQSDTLNNALLLSLGGLIGLAGTIGAFLFSRGAQGEPITPTVTAVAPPPTPGTTTTTVTPPTPAPPTPGGP
jgi:NhaP-type Na+/H+ or K+/H+ antiporter